MLTGRVNVRHAGAVVAGCFILFGAPSIAAGILSLLTIENVQPVSIASAPVPVTPTIAATQNLPFDPYGGASLPTTR